MNEVNIINNTDGFVSELEELKNLINFALAYEHLVEVTFNVILVSKEEIKTINQTYRDLDQVTDVITFALEDETNMVYPGKRILGDIYICFPQAEVQAEQYGHSLKRELSFLMIHGFYHLLGFDHQSEAEEKIMFEKQELILNEYGITR